MIKKRLWTKDFTRITLATCLTAIGGEAVNLPISLLVFDRMGSTLYSAIIMICGILPDILLPVLIAPVIDKGGKKKWIVGMDALMALLYAGMGLYMAAHTFRFLIYVVFVLLIGTISVFYRLSFNAWYPDLIPAGCEQKGYAVDGTVYPMVIIVMSPVAAFLYEKLPIHTIFLLVAAVTVVSILIEGGIHEDRKEKQERYTFKDYKTDLAEGFAFIKKEKGIRNIYTYMSITSGAGEGVNIVAQAYYQTSPFLTVTMYGFLKSGEMVGRLFGGLFQYVKEIPVKRRYGFTKFVYTVYSLLEACLLFLPFPAMTVNRFCCGILGCNSATIREAAVQSYLPANMRARVNALFSMAMAAGSIFFQLAAGIMGQYLSYRSTAVILAAVSLVSMVVLIVVPAKDNRPVYEAVRKI